MNAVAVGAGEWSFPLTRREARRPLPLERGRGGGAVSSLRVNPTHSLRKQTNQPHLYPVLGGEVAALRGG